MHPTDARGRLLLLRENGTGGLESLGELSETPEASLPSKPRCPFLGLATDQATAALFATEEQRCYRANRVQRIPLTTQSQVCLTPEHPRCPVFHGERSAVVPGRDSLARWRLIASAGSAAALLVMIVLATLAASGRVSVSASVSVTTPTSEGVTLK
jgi:hypothetical protein